MPRFGETEREVLKAKLLMEGERLFSTFGVKKVSIDELAGAAGIAKGSFYSFYPSKEQLFLEIVFSMQKKMWAELDAFVQEHSKLPPRDLLKQAFMWTLEQTERYPIFRMMDSETMEYLVRKVPGDVLEAHTHDDSATLTKFLEYGIRFAYEIPTIAKIMQALSMCYFNLMQEDRTERMALMGIIMDGVLKEIVAND